VMRRETHKGLRRSKRVEIPPSHSSPLAKTQAHHTTHMGLYYASQQNWIAHVSLGSWLFQNILTNWAEN
jgi:hypothetical protein